MTACEFDVPADLVSLPQKCCSSALSLARTQPVQPVQVLELLLLVIVPLLEVFFKPRPLASIASCPACPSGLPNGTIRKLT